MHQGQGLPDCSWTLDQLSHILLKKPTWLPLQLRVHNLLTHLNLNWPTICCFWSISCSGQSYIFHSAAAHHNFTPKPVSSSSSSSWNWSIFEIVSIQTLSPLLKYVVDLFFSLLHCISYVTHIYAYQCVVKLLHDMRLILMITIRIKKMHLPWPANQDRWKLFKLLSWNVKPCKCLVIQ